MARPRKTLAGPRPTFHHPTLSVAAALVAVSMFVGCTMAPTEPPAETTVVQGPTLLNQPLSSAGSASSGPVSLSLGSTAGRPTGPPEIVMGTGQFVNPSGLTASGRGSVTVSGSDVTLDFTAVDVRDVLKSVLGDLLRASYTVDPAVQGTVTLQTGTPIPRSALINVLTDTLQLNGVGLVLRNGIYLAVPIANAARQAPLGGSAGFITRVATPQYVSATDLERALEPVLPAGTTMKSDPGRNLLLVSGSAQDVNRVLENVAAFDVDFMRGMSFALLPLRYGRAKDIAQDVTNMLGSSGKTISDVVKVFPIDRMNAVLVTSMQPAYIQRVRGWVERFDRGDGHTDPKLYVYRVQNGRATDIARVLRRALGIDQTDTTGRPGDTQTTDMQPTLAGTFPQSGTTSGRASPIAPPPGLATTSRADPLASVAALAGSSSSAAPNQAGLPDLRITADPANNALIIAATPQDYAQIEAALQKLDIPPLQVLIEATVAEVTLTNALSLGLQYAFQTGNFTDIFAPGLAPRSGSSTQQQTVAGTFPGFGFLSGNNLVYSSGNTTILLQTLSKMTNVKVLSSPNLMVLNNGVARLQVGDQVPIATQSATSTLTTTAQTVNSIDYRDTGIILNVIPRVNASGLVLLDISEEVSDVTKTSSSGLDSPTISQRRVTSSVAVHDGQTIALAGLIRDRTERGNNGLPWLKDLPVIGFLFGVRSDTSTRTELLVTITPRVIRSRDEGDAVTRELREKLRLTIPITSRRR